MTIQVTVKNDDSRKTAIVTVQSQGLDGKPIAGAPDKTLKGGESAECYVHSTQQLLVKEA